MGAPWSRQDLGDWNMLVNEMSPGESAALRSAFHQDCIRILHQAVSMLAQALAAA